MSNMITVPARGTNPGSCRNPRNDDDDDDDIQRRGKRKCGRTVSGQE